jgi:deaminated glutathione amidase
MTDKLRAACIQMTSGPDIAQNLKTVEMYIRQAAQQGAGLIATPENTDQIRHPAVEKLKTAPPQESHPGIPLFSGLAKELNVWLLAGSFAIKTGSKLSNRSILFSPDGKIAAQYDKIHLFDIDLPGGEKYRESDVIQSGDKTAIAKTPFGGVGLTVCYDVRFAYLFRKLAQQGANIITVPSAFTVPTGRAHWEILLRARAIETGSFIIAPGQTGEHENGRKTWGHSMIVGPWGEILAEAGKDPGIIMADINLKDVQKVRGLIPALKHDRNI